MSNSDILEGHLHYNDLGGWYFQSAGKHIYGIDPIYTKIKLLPEHDLKNCIAEIITEETVKIINFAPPV